MMDELLQLIPVSYLASLNLQQYFYRGGAALRSQNAWRLRPTSPMERRYLHYFFYSLVFVVFN